ncbi:MAG: hypothetical protein WCH34_11155 [Bacteroidota bacterium]
MKTNPKYSFPIIIFLFLIIFNLKHDTIVAQVNIATGGTYFQNFNIGTTAIATLPTGWRMDKNLNVRTLGTYSAAVSATESRAGNNMSSTASNGLYNFAYGDAATDTNRAIGGISSSSGSKSVNMYVQLFNNGANAIPSFNISYKVDKFRNGTNAAGFSMQMYYSTDGISWTAAGSAFLTSFAGSDAANTGFTPAPGAIITVNPQALNVSLSASSYLYLAWNYSVTSGTTTTNAQALAIDSVTITAATSFAPAISVGSISAFGNQIVNSTSAEKSYKVSGSFLSGNIIISPPQGFYISTTSGSGYITYPDSLVLIQNGGNVDSTTIYAVFKPTALQTYTANIIHKSAGATSRNVAVSGTGVAISDPTSLTATAISDVQINLSATANSSSNNIIVVYNSSGTFTAPTNGLAAGAIGSAFANGTILYKGAASSMVNHTGLIAQQTVYYKAFSYDVYNFYSSGITANATTFVSPPSNHPGLFSAEQGAPDYSNIDVIWNDAAGVVLPDGYLIKSSTTGYSNIPNPINGIPEANSTLTKNVLPNVQRSSFTGLSPNTIYYYKIFPYTNSGTDIKYKSDGIIPQDFQTTASMPWIEDFETGSKSNYLIANANCTKGSWTFDEALIGSLTTDHKNGLQSIRLRNSGGSVYMNFDKPNGADTVIIYHSVYGTDNPSNWKLQMSTNQGISWIDIGDSVTASTTTLTPAYFIIKQAGNVRFKIIHLSGGSANRLNIDDIHIGDFSLGFTFKDSINTSCYGGKITLNSATGGRGNNYQYAIRTPANTGIWGNWQTDTVFSGLNAGIYGVKAKDGMGNETKEFSFTIYQNRTLQVKLFLEGLFKNDSLMEAINGTTRNPQWGQGISDKIDISLYNAMPPHSLQYTQNNVNLYTNGIATMTSSCANNGNYFIAIKNRNHLQTWSAIALPFSSAFVSYDFTTDMMQAYGVDAQKQLALNKYAFYAGDLNENGTINSDDFNILDQDLMLGIIGFTPSDMNGNGWVDADDFNLFEPNFVRGISAQFP